MAKRRGHKPTRQGVKAGTVRGPYRPREAATVNEPSTESVDVLYNPTTAELGLGVTSHPGTPAAASTQDPVNHVHADATPERDLCQHGQPAASAPDVLPETPPAAPLTSGPLTGRGARGMSILRLSEVLDVNRASVERWIKKCNAPVDREGQGRGRGLEWELSLPAMWVWWGEHNRKLALAEAGVGVAMDPSEQFALLKLAEKANLVVPVHVVEMLLARVMAEVRAMAVSLPGRITREMQGFTLKVEN